MLYVDCMGNFMSNMKLAFYDTKDESGFFSLLFSDNSQKSYINGLVKSYDFLTEIYDDLLLNVRIKQCDDFPYIDRFTRMS